jgi:hypothetical protein
LSQVYKSLTSGPVPPAVPTSFTTQDGSAVPAANILIVDAFDSREDNTNGITTKGGVDAGDPPGTGLSNELSIYITNRLQGSVTTVGATSGDIITFVPTVVGTYSLEYRAAAYNTTSVLGAGYSMFGAIRFDGVNSNICDTFDEIVNEEGTMSNVDIAVVVSGSSVILRSTGYLGQTINWSAVGLYTFIGA